MVMNLHPPAVPKSKIPNDILVRDLPREDQLLFEAAQNVGMPGQLRPDDLDRYQPVELMIPDLIDRAHAAFAQAFENFVALAQHGAGLKRRVGIAWADF